MRDFLTILLTISLLVLSSGTLSAQEADHPVIINNGVVENPPEYNPPADYYSGLTQINFDDFNVGGFNSIEINPNRYPGVSFYSPYYNNKTYLTYTFRYSYPNSLIVGYDQYEPNGYISIVSVDQLVIEFAQTAKNVAFLWGNANAYYNTGRILVYNANNQLVQDIPRSIPGGSWTSISMNQYSTRIKKIILIRPAVSNNLYGHIYLDNFQFETVTTRSPEGFLDEVNVTSGVARGWSRDPDNLNAANFVDCYVDGQAGQGTLLPRVTANQSRPDVGVHGFEVPIPANFKDGNPHQLFCYGIDIAGDDPPTHLGTSPKPFTISPSVESVVFESINSQVINGETVNSQIDITSSHGLTYQRIFPDKWQPDEQNINRKIVRVKAKLTSAKQGVQVYFKNFDVDDPSNDNDFIDDNGNLGNDNRDGRVLGQSYPASAAGSFVSNSSCVPTTNGTRCSTDTNGEAVAYFRVTKQPGDNFVVAASTDDSYLTTTTVNGTGLKDSGNNPLPTSSGKRTDLLIVWRRLYMEVDSMGEAKDNFVKCFYAEKGTYIGSQPKDIEVYCPDIYENDAYKNSVRSDGTFLSYGGRMVIAGVHTLQVVDNSPFEPEYTSTNGPTRQVLRVQSLNGDVYLRPKQPFKLYDDDDFNNSDGANKDGDEGENIDLLPDTLSRMRESDNVTENAFAEAYIKPQYQWAAPFNNPNVNFTPYVPCSDSVDCPEHRTLINQNRGSQNSERDDFWIGYLLVSYQESILGDADPTGGYFGYAPNSYPGSRQNEDFYNPNTGVPPGGIGAIIFIETMRDFDLFPFTTIPPHNQVRSRIATHEVGHQFGVGHYSQQSNGGIMSYIGDLNFHPAHINMMRWRVKSPGEGQ